MPGEVSTGETVELSPREERDVRALEPARAAVVFETLRREGENELQRSALSLLASGFAAGLSMGMSFAAQGLIQSMLPDTSWRPLVSGLGYSVGFVIVILGRQQLFTENTVTAILPLLDSSRKVQDFVRVLRLWALVLLSNLIGTGIFSYTTAKTTIFNPAVKTALLDIGMHAANASFAAIVERGIFAGWLIALLVWLLPVANQLRFFVIIFITYFVAIGSFSHIIAGSTDVLYAVADGRIAFWSYVMGYLLPVFIGNSLGGVTLVSLLNYAQVVSKGE